jgi:hypothetical protein
MQEGLTELGGTADLPAHPSSWGFVYCLTAIQQKGLPGLLMSAYDVVPLTFAFTLLRWRHEGLIALLCSARRAGEPPLQCCGGTACHLALCFPGEPQQQGAGLS